MATGVDAARDLRGSRQRVQHALAAAIETVKGLDDESVGAEFSAALDPLLMEVGHLLKCAGGPPPPGPRR